MEREPTARFRPPPLPASTPPPVSDEVFFDGVRHGTPVEVPFEIFRQVALKAGE